MVHSKHERTKKKTSASRTSVDIYNCIGQLGNRNAKRALSNEQKKMVRPLLLLLGLWAASGISPAKRPMSIRLYNGTVAKLWPREADIGNRFQCGHSSYSVVSCIKSFVDLDHNDGITAAEIDNAKSTYMYWYEKLFDSIANAGSSEAIVARCDLNLNERIDVDDLIEWNHKCSAYQTEAEANTHKHQLCLCNCESIDAISKYICDRAREEV